MTAANPIVDRLPLIKVVGVSASGKSTLVVTLREFGYNARPVSQEHSDVAELWKQFGLPHILIFLDNDLDGQRSRRPDVEWDAVSLLVERDRLRNAHAHADLRINTATLTADQVRNVVVAFLEAKCIRRAQAPLPPIPRTGGGWPG